MRAAAAVGDRVSMLWTGEFRLTSTLGSKLQALLGPLAKPRIDPGAELGGSAATTDVRHHGQRMHDALEDCDRLMRSDRTRPDSGARPPP